MDPLALRCLVDTPIENDSGHKIVNYSKSQVMTFDTETTNDEYQNLRFGSCCIHVNGKLDGIILFYNDGFLKESDVEVLKKYAEEHRYPLMTLNEFLERVFFPKVFRERVQLVGFNLPFDLSRLANSYTGSVISDLVNKTRKPNDGISLQLSPKPWYPGIAIKSLDTKRAFIWFTAPMRKKGEKRRVYRGCFIDLRTFSFALTNTPYNLKDALDAFQCVRKKSKAEHGKSLKSEYIDYNINDSLATHELYEKALERYALFCLKREPRQLYSPASIGKDMIDRMGILSFYEKNPAFPREIIGYLMTAYYGGRVEVRIRKRPVLVTYLDFLSMYPSLYVLLGLDKILKANTVKWADTTQETQEFLNRVTLEGLRNKETWKRLNCICRLKPDNDVLPARSHYGDKYSLNIGVNYIKSNISLWYALPDVIASKLYTGKAPIIEEAITFTPEGIQLGLQEIEVLKGIWIKPEEDIFKKLIEERIRIKKLMKTTSGDELKQLKLLQLILKIIANSSSYGIYVQIDPNDEKQSNVSIYGLEHFINTKEVKKETPGPAFNPIMATMITSGAKLILAMAENLVLSNGGYVAYCDTDSIFVSPQHEQLVKDFFKPLNPYDVDQDMFKVEDNNQEPPVLFRNMLFYGISAKRYCLYDLDKEPIIQKYSLHGLGENLMGIKPVDFWKDILRIHYHPEERDDIISKYEDRHAVYKFGISTNNVYKRFSGFNEGKPLSKQIKPFNFITIGVGYQKNPKTNKPIIPMLRFIKEDDKRFEEIPYMDFIDYKTGDRYPHEGSMDTQFYWKPLSELFEAYIDHPESKSEGGIGVLTRKHMTFDKTSIRYIGKESNDLDEKQTTGLDEESYTTYENTEMANQRIMDDILNMSEAEALEQGWNRRAFYRARANIRTAGSLGRSRLRNTSHLHLR